uniref:lysoplasmalogenase n=1 Tax=Panagrellus redivivus TaxID=6233 RepID=A0A7E4USS5_PANRE
MKCLTIFVLFVAIFYAQTSSFDHKHTWEYPVLKTLPCLVLSALVHFGMSPLKGQEASYHAKGLFLGAVGDLLLALSENGLYPGAVAFAIGHIYYMAVIAPKIIQIHINLALVAFVYAAGINYAFLVPALTASPLSTLIMMAYSIILTTGVVLAGSLYLQDERIGKSATKSSDLLLFAGFALFMISDSLLLLCYLGRPIPYSNQIVLFTYFGAQYAILCGASRQLV